MLVDELSVDDEADDAPVSDTRRHGGDLCAAPRPSQYNQRNRDSMTILLEMSLRFQSNWTFCSIEADQRGSLNFSPVCD